MLHLLNYICLQWFQDWERVVDHLLTRVIMVYYHLLYSKALQRSEFETNVKREIRTPWSSPDILRNCPNYGIRKNTPDSAALALHLKTN